MGGFLTEADMKGWTKVEEKRMDKRCTLRDGIDGFGYYCVVALYLKVIWSSFKQHGRHIRMLAMLLPIIVSFM